MLLYVFISFEMPSSSTSLSSSSSLLFALVSVFSVPSRLLHFSGTTLPVPASRVTEGVEPPPAASRLQSPAPAGVAVGAMTVSVACYKNKIKNEVKSITHPQNS